MTAASLIYIYKAKATKPATTAAPLINFCTAAPVKVAIGGLIGVALVPPAPPVGVLVAFIPTITKLAQVNLVALAVWTTIDRFPKKLAGPGCVEV